MKVLFLILFLSQFGNEVSDNGIPYRTLAWSDFRSPVPASDIFVAARTTTELVLETTDIDGHFSFVVKAYFLPFSSYVRVRSEVNLRHEQTHFKIACIEAGKCMKAFAPLQIGDSLDKGMAETLYNHFVEESARRNEQFDKETNHCLNKGAEKVWEDRISSEWRIFGIPSKTEHGRNR